MLAVRNMCLVLFPPTLLILLEADPQTCMDRIRRRNRPQEKDITLEYLGLVEEGYGQLQEESKTRFYPWSHAVEIMPIPWDVDTATPQQWERISRVVQRTLDRRALPEYAKPNQLQASPAPLPR
jgi:deoxyadenosine/deoxycytidine kinase